MNLYIRAYGLTQLRYFVIAFMILMALNFVFLLLREFLPAFPLFRSMKIYNAMISSMNLEILNGEGPDILYGSYNSFSTYEDKGLFVDLYTLMDKDKSFKKDDYLPSVFKMCENDGHLYKMGIGFYINGLMGAKSVIGDRTGWTVDEFNEMVNSLPSGMKPLSGNGYTQSSLLTYSLSACKQAFYIFSGCLIFLRSLQGRIS